MNPPTKPTDDRNVLRHLATARQNVDNGWGSSLFYQTPGGRTKQVTFDSYTPNNNNTPLYYLDDYYDYFGELHSGKRRGIPIRFDDNLNDGILMGINERIGSGPKYDRSEKHVYETQDPNGTVNKYLMPKGMRSKLFGAKRTGNKSFGPKNRESKFFGAKRKYKF